MHECHLFNGEAYKTVSGQNSNNSVRITDEFMETYFNHGEWHTNFRTNGEICETYKAKDLMGLIADSAWHCVDPGVQYDSTINKWHSCKVSGRINSSNPCSEYMFLDDTACNLASLNLLKFLKEDGSFDLTTYRHAVRLFLIAHFPCDKINNLWMIHGQALIFRQYVVNKKNCPVVELHRD